MEYPDSRFDPNVDYMKELVETQKALKEENRKKHAVDHKTDRFNMRYDQERRELEAIERKYKENVLAATEYFRFQREMNRVKPDIRGRGDLILDDKKWNLQHQMLLSYESLKPQQDFSDGLLERHKGEFGIQPQELSEERIQSAREVYVPVHELRRPVSAAYFTRRPFVVK